MNMCTKYGQLSLDSVFNKLKMPNLKWINKKNKCVIKWIQPMWVETSVKYCW